MNRVKLSLSLLLRVLSPEGSGVRLRSTLTAEGLTKIDTGCLYPRIERDRFFIGV